jgi:hypothetical protein
VVSGIAFAVRAAMATARIAGNRDLRIDCLRGLAMVCVIVNHSQMPSLLSWFSYERFWVVTAAEVFVVLSGVVLGMVYGRRLTRMGWRAVVEGLGRRALLLYGAFVAVTLSLIAMAMMGVDVGSVARPGDRLAGWLLAPGAMDASSWRDLLLMRSGPWAFEIIALYVWLIVAAVPCLIALHYAGWQPVVGLSWIVYVAYRIAPLRLTGAEFEVVFPILAWQLLFVHGIVFGYHRERIREWFAGRWRIAFAGGAAATAFFAALAFCSPWVDGPSWLRLHLLSPDRFTELYVRYFGLSELGMGRLANLTVALPTGYAVLGLWPTLMRPFQALLVTLGQRSLGAFVLHVYTLVLVTHIPHRAGLVTNTALQLLMLVGIAAVLRWLPRTAARPAPVVAPDRALAA